MPTESPSPSRTTIPTLSPTPKSLDQSWLYQLQDIKLDTLQNSSAAYLVIDPSKGGDGDDAGFWSPEDLVSVKESGKIVLAYLSIGEAEDYRDYWKDEWTKSPPSFLNRANVADGYEDNYLVAYWDPAWQELVSQRLEKLSQLGFDGVYLDKVDAFEDWQDADPSKPEEFLRKEMVKFIARLSKRGRASKKDGKFELFLQNGWSIWSEPELKGLVTGVGVEEFTLGWEGEDGNPTPNSTKKEIEEALRAFPNVPVLIVDYPSKKSSAADRDKAIQEAKRVGAVPVLTDRDLSGSAQ